MFLHNYTVSDYAPYNYFGDKNHGSDRFEEKNYYYIEYNGKYYDYFRTQGIKYGRPINIDLAKERDLINIKKYNKIRIESKEILDKIKEIIKNQKQIDLLNKKRVDTNMKISKYIDELKK